jgi:2-iminoacetate synthase ThiH
MLRRLIADAGFIPQQRDILYRHIDRERLPKPSELRDLVCRT